MNEQCKCGNDTFEVLVKNDGWGVIHLVVCQLCGKTLLMAGHDIEGRRIWIKEDK